MVLDCGGGGDDLSFWDDSDDKLDSSLDLDREWQRRHDQFHTVFAFAFWKLVFLIFASNSIILCCD